MQAVFSRLSKRLTPCAIAILGVIGLASGRAAASDKPISLELNKLETAGKDCRLFFLTDNASTQPWTSLKLDLIFFGSDGIIAQRLGVEFGPLAATKKRVRTVDLVGSSCSGIGSVLLNDAIDCRTSRDPVADCLQQLVISSRAKTPFNK